MNKVFAVVMAVICVMSLTYVTAFAAETDLPPGAQLVSNDTTWIKTEHGVLMHNKNGPRKAESIVSNRIKI